MYKRNNMKIMVGAFIGLGAIMLITLIYAAFTGQLNVAGSGVSRVSKWDVHFANLSTITTSHTAKVLAQPRLESGASIEDYSVSVTSPGDTISFTVDVVNEGNYNAEITSVSVSSPSCSGEDSTSNTNVCNHLHYSLTYDNGASVQVGDTLYAKETNTMKVTLNYDDTVTSSELPTEEVSISNLGITINFQKSSDALVKDNGEVADYSVYKIGNKISVHNEDYWVIANSGAGQDYVVALKDEPLTVAEVNTYGVGHISQYAPASVGTVFNVNGYGGISYYSSETCGRINGVDIFSGCTNYYENSEIKFLIDAWSTNKFQNDELKEVSNFKARLIKDEEYQNIISYNWRYGNYKYFTMSPSSSVQIVKFIKNDGSLSNNTYAFFDPSYKGYSYYGYVFDGDMVARPVINVYKSAIDSNNNE